MRTINCIRKNSLGTNCGYSHIHMLSKSAIIALFMLEYDTTPYVQPNTKTYAEKC